MSSRTTAPLLLGACALLLGACSVDLPYDLTAEQAAEVVRALSAEGVAAERTAAASADRYHVVVASAARGEAQHVLAMSGLPRDAPSSKGELAGIEGGVLPSPALDRSRLASLRSRQIEGTLAALPGVVTARVTLDLPPPDLLRADGARPRATAAVVLRATEAFVTSDELLRGIVAAAVESLQPDDVQILVATGTVRTIDGARLTPLGPIEISARTRRTAILLILGGAFSLLLLGAALVWSLRARAVASRAATGAGAGP